MRYSHDTLELEMAMATDVGRVRQRNEDEVRILPEAGAAILADGMGGHQAGDVASRLAIEVVAEEIENSEQADEEALIRWIETANSAIRGVASTHSGYRGMGATIVVTVCRGEHLLFSHVGDSRLYRLWNNTLHQLTEDHTLVQQYINEGMISSSESRTWSGRNLLTKALGIEDSVDPVSGRATLRPGQSYLLCSDGLTEAVTDDHIAEVLSRPDHSAQAVVDTLVSMANANGGPDNISVALIRPREKSHAGA
jgi:PPM family protein phosphatase